MPYQRLASTILGLYHRLDRQTLALRKRTGLACPRGCGECCHRHRVEATVLEMLPLAVHLWRTGGGEGLLERLGPGEARERCLLYRPGEEDPSRGRCSQYPCRPLICRLYGFSAITDKQGRKELLLCRKLREIYAPRIAAWQQMIRSADLPVPVMADYTLQVNLLAPRYIGEWLPINQALRSALEMTGWTGKGFRQAG